MVDRSFKLYTGEDLSPVKDWTDFLRWEEAEFGMVAHNLESSASSFPVLDEGGVLSPPVRNVTEVKLGSNTLFRGRIGTDDYARLETPGNRDRTIDLTCDDYNADTRGIHITGSYPAQTDVARVQQILSGYLSGSPRNTTRLNGSNYVSGSNTVTLAAQTYNLVEVTSALTEIATLADKDIFVDVDGNLHYDGHDSNAFLCPLYITDREDELRADPTTALSVIWDMGPATHLDGINGNLASQIIVVYGPDPDDFRSASNPVTGTNHAYWEEVVYVGQGDQKVTASQAQAIANTLSARRAFPGRTYSGTVANADGGPLTDAQVGSIKAGMRIRIKARVTPDVQDAFLYRRIVECKLTTPTPGQWFAHLRLDRPLHGYPMGDPNGPGKPGIAQPLNTPTAAVSYEWHFAGVVAATDLDEDHHVGAPYSYEGQGNHADATDPTYGSIFNSGFMWKNNVDAVTGTMPAAANTAYSVSADALQAGVGWTDLDIIWRPSGTVSVIYSHIPGVKTAITGSATSPAGTTGMELRWNNNGTSEFACTNIIVSSLASAPSGDGPPPASTDEDGDLGDSDDAARADHAHPVQTANVTPTLDTGQYFGVNTVEYSLSEAGRYIRALTTQGDTGYIQGSNWTRLPIGTSNFHLVSDGVKPLWFPQSAGGGGGVTDHGALTGLADDDHPQYTTDTVFDDHNARHETGGADAIKLDDLATPDDNTDLNSSTSRHGLLAKLSNVAGQYMDGQGSWTTPSGTAPAHPWIDDNYQPDSYPASPNAVDDEFEGGGAIDGKWTKVNDPASGDALSQTTFAGFLHVGLPEQVGGSDNFDRLVRMFQTPPAGTATAEYIVKVSLAILVDPHGAGEGGEFAGVYAYIGNSANDEMVGAGIQVNIGNLLAPIVTNGMQATAGTLANTTVSQAHAGIIPGEFVYLKLRKATTAAYTSANTYDMLLSGNGIQYHPFGTMSKTFTALCDEVGVCFRTPKPQANAPAADALVDFFRKVA